MTKVLYIGNALSEYGNTISTIDSLSENLVEFCKITTVSKKQNKMLRLLDMLHTVWRKRNKTDVVLIDTYSTTNFYYALMVSQLCRLLGLPYIPILHGGNLENRLKYHPKKSKYLFNNAKHLVAPSKFLQTVFNTYGYSDVHFIPNTIELKNYIFCNREIKQIRLLWVRSFSKIYNPVLALQLLEELRFRGHKAEMIMIGPENDGSLKYCKALAEQKNLKITFTGLLSKTEWIELSKYCNVFINTTNVDNTPVSVIEAMALGLPIVSTNVGGMPYLISNNEDGLLVPPDNSQAMHNAILRLKEDNELRKRLIRNAREKVEKFDWLAVKSKWETLLT